MSIKTAEFLGMSWAFDGLAHRVLRRQRARVGVVAAGVIDAV